MIERVKCICIGKKRQLFLFISHLLFKNVHQVFNFAGIRVKKGKWSNLEHDLLKFNMVRFLEVQLV